MNVRRVYLIRHGQTAWNVEGRWQGFEAVPLNDHGRAQARALAASWNQPLETIYSSDLQRAWETATTLGDALGLTVKTDERLREFNLGLFQGLTFKEIDEKYPTEVKAMHDDYMGYLIPNGETRIQLQARAYAAFQDIIQRETAESVALVSHGGTIKMLLMRLFPELPELREMHIQNTSVTTVEWVDGRWELRDMNVTSHLQMLSQDEDMH
jgi:2,3-bisphosphoglycerate-dependent phosphoglycerate mutase